MKDNETFLKWFINKFTTREYFVRLLAMLILVVASYETIVIGDISDHWLILIGTVMGYYFKFDNKSEEIE